MIWQWKTQNLGFQISCYRGQNEAEGKMLLLIYFSERSCGCPTGVAQGASSHKVKGPWFDFQSGHMPRLQVWPVDEAHARGNQSMFLSLFLPPFLYK